MNVARSPGLQIVKYLEKNDKLTTIFLVYHCNLACHSCFLGYFSLATVQNRCIYYFRYFACLCFLSTRWSKRAVRLVKELQNDLEEIVF